MRSHQTPKENEMCKESVSVGKAKGLEVEKSSGGEPFKTISSAPSI